MKKVDPVKPYTFKRDPNPLYPFGLTFDLINSLPQSYELKRRYIYIYIDNIIYPYVDIYIYII